MRRGTVAGALVAAQLACSEAMPRLEELEYRENRVLRGPKRLVVGYDDLLA